MFVHVVSGIVAAFVVAVLGYRDHSFGLYLGCFICAVWPDVDNVLNLIKLRMKRGGWRKALEQATGKWAHEHRNILHIPLLVAPITVTLASWSPFWAVIFALLSLSHFLLDSFGIGWGIRWLYPFNRKNYKFFYDKAGKPTLKNPIVFWEPEELRKTVEQHGNPDWVKNPRSWM